MAQEECLKRSPCIRLKNIAIQSEILPSPFVQWQEACFATRDQVAGAFEQQDEG
jgi:hypothetical protein